MSAALFPSDQTRLEEFIAAALAADVARQDAPLVTVRAEWLGGAGEADNRVLHVTVTVPGWSNTREAAPLRQRLRRAVVIAVLDALPELRHGPTVTLMPVPERPAAR